MPELIALLKAMSDETRYKLVGLLVSNDYCVGALAQRLEISESAVSQHLKILREAGIVQGEKRGYYTHYHVDRDLLKEAAADLSKIADTTPDLRNCNSRGNPDKCCGKEG